MINPENSLPQPDDSTAVPKSFKVKDRVTGETYELTGERRAVPFPLSGLTDPMEPTFNGTGPEVEGVILPSFPNTIPPDLEDNTN